MIDLLSLSANPESVFFFSSRRRHTRSLRDWSSDVCSSELADGIADRYHDERNRRPRLLIRLGGGCAGGNDHVDLRGDQLGDERRKTLILSFRPSIFDHNVLTFDVTEIAQPVTERPDEIGLKGGCRIPQETYPGNFGRLLCLSHSPSYPEHEGDCQKPQPFSI